MNRIPSIAEAAGDYHAEVVKRAGEGWNRFWFTPSDPRLLCFLRILVGGSAFVYLLTFTARLPEWFGTHGLLPAAVVWDLTGAAAENSWVFHWSYLYYVGSPAALSVLHGLGLLVVLAFTAGCYTRVTSVLALIVVLSYVHRAPMITGLWEPVLTMMLLYLCLGPCGATWSCDGFWRRRGMPGGTPMFFVTATLSRRLMQVHLAAFYLMMGLTKLGGECWWSGEAVWWLMARTESRLLDLTAMHSAIVLVNLWSHAIAAFELSFGVLIWFRLARPLLLGLAVVAWGSLALITGLVGFCAMMLIANLCFLPPSLWYRTRHREKRRHPA